MSYEDLILQTNASVERDDYGRERRKPIHKHQQSSSIQNKRHFPQK